MSVSIYMKRPRDWDSSVAGACRDLDHWTTCICSWGLWVLASLILSGDPCSGQDVSSERRVRVASISFEPVKFDLSGNVLRLEKWFRRAAEAGAEIAVAPEGILEGYVVNEIIANEVAAERMLDVALTIDSPTLGQFRALAQELDMCLVFGFAERIDENVFNCAVFIDNAGKICGKYHKMQLAEGYNPSWWFNRLGHTSRAFDTPLGRCGILICNDRWNPQLAQIPANDGAQFLLIPSFGSTSQKQDEAVLARAVENHLPIVEANVGVSLIVDRDEIIAVQRQLEGITLADINIPAPRPIDAETRDQIESEFLQWRAQEMPQRWTQRQSRIVEKKSENP